MTEHKHAEILRAIADGKEMQFLCSPVAWKDCSGDKALAYILSGADVRMKPETKTVWMVILELHPDDTDPEKQYNSTNMFKTKGQALRAAAYFETLNNVAVIEVTFNVGEGLD